MVDGNSGSYDPEGGRMASRRQRSVGFSQRTEKSEIDVSEDTKITWKVATNLITCTDVTKKNRPGKCEFFIPD